MSFCFSVLFDPVVSCSNFVVYVRLVRVDLRKMFTVQELKNFPADAQPFRDITEADDAMKERGLQVDTTTCASCPQMSRKMEMPHLFSHKYAGITMLFRGQEEWQMCKIVSEFVHDNSAELKDDTKQYFSTMVGPTNSVVQLAMQMCKRFMYPTAAMIYLFARACNAHTCVHFANCTWSTVHDHLPYYVAVELAAVGDWYVLLTSLEQDTMEFVVGQIQVWSHEFAVNDAFAEDDESVCSEPVSSCDEPPPQVKKRV